MPRLRGHHLICLHFFNGMGYDSQFIEDLSNVLERAEREEVAVVTGPDEVCSRCPHLKAGRCTYTAGAEDEITAMDREALRLLGLSSGVSVSWREVRRVIQGVFSRWHSAYCAGCDWRRACEQNFWFKELHAKTRQHDLPLGPDA